MKEEWAGASACVFDPRNLQKTKSQEINKFLEETYITCQIQMYPDRDAIPQLLPSQLSVCLFCCDC